MAVRVLLADDQAMVRAGFRMILELEEGIEVVGEAQDGEEAVTAARRARPDVIVMDVRMPRLDGVAATRRVVEELEPPPRVLVVTTFDEDEAVYEALRAGASGFLLKNAPPEQLVEAVRAVAAGDGLLSPEVTRRVIEEFARRSPPSDGAGDGRAGRADRARARGAAADGARAVQRRDRRPAGDHPGDREDPRRPDPHEARARQPRPGRGARLRVRPRPAGVARLVVVATSLRGVWVQREITLRPRPRGFHLVTDEVVSALPELRELQVGLAHLFILHTSASLTLNENASPDVRRDFETWFNEVVPEDAPYWEHTIEGPDDMPAHIKASLLGPSLSLPVSGGRLALGTWQGVYLCEHRDHGGARSLAS